MPNFDQKLFMFPESYNQLRTELSTHWNDDKNKKPYWRDWQCGWAQAWDAEIFIEYMNTHTDGAYRVLAATNDKQKEIGYICECFLKELRRRRGEPNP